MAIGFLTMFFRKANARKLRIGADFIEIPERWKYRTKLNFNEIVEIGEFETYDNVIEIQSGKGIHLIERNWMRQGEFEKVKGRLKEYWMSR